MPHFYGTGSLSHCFKSIQKAAWVGLASWVKPKSRHELVEKEHELITRILLQGACPPPTPPSRPVLGELSPALAAGASGEARQSSRRPQLDSSTKSNTWLIRPITTTTGKAAARRGLEGP